VVEEVEVVALVVLNTALAMKKKDASKDQKNSEPDSGKRQGNPQNQQQKQNQQPQKQNSQQNQQDQGDDGDGPWEKK